MKYKTLLDGTKIPVLGLGTWRLGGSMAADYSQDEQVVEIMQTAIRLGYTHIDTAEIYGNGHTEELVGRAIQGFEREDLFITSKIWQSNLQYEAVHHSVEGSLKRLQTDYLDLCLIHWPNANIPLKETLRALDELVAQGMIRSLGVSNFDLEQLKEACSLAKTPIVTNQVPYNLYNRVYAHNGVLGHCQASGILLTAYTPFERGEPLRNPVVKQIADKYNVTAAEVALCWLIRQPNVITIPMSTNPQHLETNLGALKLELSAEDLQQLERLTMPDESLWPE